MPSPSTWFTVALIAVHRVHHGMQGGIQELLGGFGVEATDEFQGVFDIRKQHCDLLPLAFQGSTGRTDLLDQRRGSVREQGTLWHGDELAIPGGGT